MKFLLHTLLIFGACGLLSGQNTLDKVKVDKYLNTLYENNKYMGSVAIMKDGKVIYAYATGYIDQAQTPSSPNTRYRIGSVSKTFTATMIMQLVEENKLTLDQKLSEFYPAIPNADTIDIGMMLHHRSGIRNFTNDPAFAGYYTQPKSRNELMEIFNGQESAFEPNSKTSYSNTNYVLLGYIIEDIDKMSYADALYKRIIKPLNLQRTSYGDSIQIDSNEANSFSWIGGKWKMEAESHMSIPGGAGAIVSTSTDLLEFMNALFNEKLVSAESLEKMTSMENGYGMGMFPYSIDTMKAYGHNGGIDGFVSNAVYFPEENMAFVTIANGLNYNNDDVLLGVAEIAFDREFEIPSFEAIEVDMEQLAKYIGLYQTDKLSIDVDIFVENNKLMAQASGQAALPLEARSEEKFVFDRAGIVMLFQKNDAGEYDTMILYQGGGEFEMKKKIK